MQFRLGDRVSYLGNGHIVEGTVTEVTPSNLARIAQDGGHVVWMPFDSLKLIGIGSGGKPVDHSKPPSGGFDFGWAWPFILIATGIGQGIAWLWRNTLGRLFGRPMD